MPCEEDDDEGEDVRRRLSGMDHSLHPHQLSSYHSKTQTKIECKICNNQIQSGDFLGCLDCRFFLDASCAQPPMVIRHYLHPEHTLTFARFPDEKGHKCPICEFRVASDPYCYACQMCDFFIHQTCASATLSDLEKGAGMTVQCSFHEHDELKLCYNYAFFGNCTVCEGSINVRTLAYKCFSSQGCPFKLHKSCAQLPSELEHPSHSLHPLTLCFKPPDEDDILCRRCHWEIGGPFAFSCGECNFYLHVDCAQIPTLKHPFHDHVLFFHFFGERSIKQVGNDFRCTACLKTSDFNFFRCSQCDFNLHYECSQLPPTVKSKHHCGQLVLHQSFIEDDSGEYHCAICKRRRDPKKWVYSCETCNYNFVAHIKCALSPVKLEVIEEDDVIRRNEDIRRRKERIKLAQEQVDAEEESLKSLLAKLETMRAKLESERAELEELKTERAKWIDMEAIKEEEVDATDGKSRSTDFEE